MTRNKINSKRIFLTLLLLSMFFALTGCMITIPLFPPQRPLREQVIAGSGNDKILLIDISGVISMEDKSELSGMYHESGMIANLKEQLLLAQEDTDIKAIVLRINSPGGTVTASDIIHHELLLFKKIRNVKIVASMLDMGTSGAYYIATAADRIWAHPTTITGSIGVMVMKFNLSELMQKIGLQDETIKSGDKKDILMPFRPVSAEEHRIVQGLVDQMQQRFLQVIREGRPNIDVEKLLEVADGRILSPQEAQSVGLIDQIGFLENAINDARVLAGLTTAKVITYKPPYIERANIYTQAQSISSLSSGGQTHAAFPLSFNGLLPSPTPYFMYLWLPQMGQ